MQRIAENVNPVFVKTSSNTATFTSGSQSGTIYFSGKSTTVEFTDGSPSAKFTVVAPVFKTVGTSVYSPGSNGGSGGSGSGVTSGAQQTIIIEINSSNIDQFSSLLSGGSLFESLFDSTTNKSMSAVDGSSEFVFAPQLNTTNLPSGAVSLITVPTITTKGDGSSISNPLMTGLASSNAKLISINNQAGVFELQQDSVLLSELAPGFNLLIGGFGGGDKLVYNGTTYEGILGGTATNTKPEFFNFLFGFGTGEGNKVSGIQIGYGMDVQGQKAVMLIGVFGDIVVPN